MVVARATRALPRCLLLLAFGIAATACSDEPATPAKGPIATTSVVREVMPLSAPSSGGSIQWPKAFAPLPTCATLVDASTMPELVPMQGALRLAPSGHATPIGEIESVEVTVVDAGGQPDLAAKGVLTLQLGPGLTLVEAPPLQEGHATLLVRVDAEGLSPLTITAPATAGAAAGAQVSVGLRGYVSQLPRLHLEVAPADMKALLADPHNDLWVQATLREVVGSSDLSHPARLRLHGGSSREFGKKSFRVELQQGHRLLDGRWRAVLRAEFVDKSQLRNWLSLDLIRSATWLPASRARHVHLRLNHAYWGVMLDVERVDADFLQRVGLERNGSFYEGDPPRELANPGANFTPLASMDLYRAVYIHHGGPWQHDDLVVLVADVLQRSDEALAKDVDKIVAVDDVLVYWATMVLIQNADMVRKNFYLYRGVDGPDQRWRLLPWDMDLSWGHLWTEENDIFEEAIFTDQPLWIGHNTGGPFYNHLIDRLWKLPQWRARYLFLLATMVDTIFDPELLVPRIDAMACLIAPDVLADRRKRADNAEWAQRVQEVRDFIIARRQVLQTLLAEAGP